MSAERADWLAWRRGGVGASDVAGLMGLSPWASPWSVWADKTGLTPPSEPSELMEFGTRAEAMIGPWFADRTGLFVVGEQTWCEHPKEPWARCTVDGFVADSPDAAVDDVLGVLEIKTTGASTWDVIPAHHQAQAQWQLYVTGLAVVHFAVLHGRRFRTYELERDDDDIELLAERAERFWHDHVVAGQPPPVDGSSATTDALRAAYGAGDAGVAVEVDAALVERLVATRAALRHARTAEETAAQAVKAALGEATTGTVHGFEVCSWRTSSRRGLDLDRLEADHHLLLEPYRTTTEVRTLRTKGSR